MKSVMIALARSWLRIAAVAIFPGPVLGAGLARGNCLGVCLAR